MSELQVFVRRQGQEDFREVDVAAEQPSIDEVMLMDAEGRMEAVDGCICYELDGFCEHGCPSWALVMGLV